MFVILFRVFFPGEIPMSRLPGKAETFSSPHKLHATPVTTNHILRDFPDNYESFRNGVSPERRSSTSSENDSVVSDKQPAIRNLSKTFLTSNTFPDIRKTHTHDRNNSTKRTDGLHRVHSPRDGSVDPSQRLKSSATSASKNSPSLARTGASSQQKNFALNSPGSVSSGSDGSKSVDGDGKEKEGRLWPAWVYCTRYSDRPSSGKSKSTSFFLHLAPRHTK